MRRLDYRSDRSNGTGASLPDLDLEELEPLTPTSSESPRPSIQNAPNSHPLVQPVLPRLPDVKTGKQSVVKHYCLQAIKEGHTKCIWLCMKRGRRWIAKDIKLEACDSPLGVGELRKMCGWWKRHSLYSVVGVKEVMMRFIDFDESRNEIRVAVIDFAYADLKADFDRAIGQLEEEFDVFKCIADTTGKSYDDRSPCNDFIVDDKDWFWKAERSRSLSLRRDDYQWLPSMIEYYWQHGIGEKAMEFLECSNFVTEYSNLTEDKDFDAANPYGKTINAFMLVEGWHIRYLLCLVAASIGCSICIAAVTAVVSQKFDAGLTVGSYSLGLSAVLLAALAALSMIL